MNPKIYFYWEVRMIKKGFNVENVPRVIRPAKDTPGWSLCIGAGTSVPIFPDWYTLAKELAQKITPELQFNIYTLKAAGFSPDAMIQMVKNQTDMSDVDFATHMSDVLYSRLKAQVAPEDWDNFADVLSSDFITGCSIEKWKVFSKYRETILKNTTATQIAKVLFEAIEKGCAPQEILSFNAEPILLIILNSLLISKERDFVRQTIPKKVFSKVISSVSNQDKQRIPYIFCHGLLPVGQKHRKFSTSVDKLCFLEEEYLQIANNSFSWQATTFLNACMCQHVVFIGTSLTDPNMRRWLSWVYTNRLNEMKENGLCVNKSTQHYWINKIPDDASAIPWIESAVAHLGIRLIWIKDWSQCSLALRKLLGLSSGSKKKRSRVVKKQKGKNN